MTAKITQLLAVSVAVFYGIHLLAKPQPPTMTKEFQEASNEYAKVCFSLLPPPGHRRVRKENQMTDSSTARKREPHLRYQQRRLRGRGIRAEWPQEGINRKRKRNRTRRPGDIQLDPVLDRVLLFIYPSLPDLRLCALFYPADDLWHCVRPLDGCLFFLSFRLLVSLFSPRLARFTSDPQNSCTPYCAIIGVFPL